MGAGGEAERPDSLGHIRKIDRPFVHVGNDYAPCIHS